jgi:M6 family metalloprotease-like protein
MSISNKNYTYIGNTFIKNVIVAHLVIILAFPAFATAKSQNIKVLKKEDPRIIEHFQKIKRLPKIYREKFQRFHKPERVYRKSGEPDSVNLLVLLVDFVKEEPDDDPKTTGDGKFDFERYDKFEIDGKLDSIRTIGSPPHDSTYFHQIIIALRYYYQTASLGILDSTNFHFKIFPNQADTAYHLPHKMAYYNPDTDDWDLKTARFIEYFKDAITSADTTEFLNTPNITFPKYNHIILIHAGSDWQHDVFLDTPCDLPAFFISLEDDSIAVNDSTYFVKEAASVPETMSQDFYKSGHLQFGFAALNAEIVHEFGHSLGLVDLYNTSNMFPAVGYWDIMDCGGMTAAISIDATQSPPDTLVIEGILPILPSAWSRLLLWGNEFGSSEKYLEITSPTDMSIDAAELPFVTNPQFIKIPINDKEYFLLENRETDLDGDGTCGIKAWSDPNDPDSIKRVPLYPVNPETGNKNNEYDFMLPGWGGLCIWHIDDYVIYDETIWVNGKPYSRFEANSVNAKPGRKGVKLIEADNIWDIGNPYSACAAGTEYEPFFCHKPFFAADGSIVGWSSDIHNMHFGPATAPNSYSNDDVNSLIDISEISNFGNPMTFKFQYQLYDNITSITPENKFNPKNEILYWADPAYPNNIKNTVIASDSAFTIYTEWFETSYTYNFRRKISHPLSLLRNKNDNLIIIPFQDSIAVLPFYIFPGNLFGTIETFTDTIYDSPIPLSDDKILVPTKNQLEIFKIEDNKLLFCKKEGGARNPKIAFNNSKKEIVVLNYPNKISIYDTSLSIPPIAEFSIPFSFDNFYPVIENRDTTQVIYFQDAVGSIYKITSDNEIEKIFIGENYNFNEISNISLGDVNNDGWHDIVFTADNTIYAIQSNGALLGRFPQSPNSANYSPSVSPIIGKSLLPENISLFLPTASNWTQAFSEDCELVPNYSFSVGNCQASPYLNISNNSAQFYLPVSDSLIKVFSFECMDTSLTKIYWNGYKNGPERWSCVNQISNGIPKQVRALQVFAFPNPAEKGPVTIRINSPKDTHSSVKIYNLAAELLFKDEIPIYADINNSFVWNIDKISSGIYFAIVKVGTQKKLVKIGVAK